MIFGLFLGQKWALAAPQELAQQHERHKNVVFLVSGHDGNEEIGGCGQKIDFWPKNPLLGPKRGTLGNRGRKTARRAAKRPPTGKPKLSRVTSGYGGLKIPLGRIRLTPKNGGYMAQERKELPEIGWCQNDRNSSGLGAVHSDFSVKGPKRAFLALFWAPGGLRSIFFPNRGKWGIQNGVTICPDHTALFRSI